MPTNLTLIVYHQTKGIISCGSKNNTIMTCSIRHQEVDAGLIHQQSAVLMVALLGDSVANNDVRTVLTSCFHETTN